MERQRKASVSSSGLSDRSPLNVDSDRSPAAFSSEGERSPATKSPHTPGFGSTKQISPAPEKSPNVAAFSPLGKAYSSFDEKNKYQANGALKVGFYQDITDKNAVDKMNNDGKKSNGDPKAKESPIYSPTVPYVSTFYSSKQEPGLSKQKSPGRYSSFYSSVESSSTLDKPKTPGYYSASAPSTPSDKPSPVSSVPEQDPKSKTQYNYYTYDPTKPLTDQYKNTGSAHNTPTHQYKSPGSAHNTPTHQFKSSGSAQNTPTHQFKSSGSAHTTPTHNKTPNYYSGHESGGSVHSPASNQGPLSVSLASPIQMGLTPQPPSVPDRSEVQPLKKRPTIDCSTPETQSSDSAHWGDKKSASDVTSPRGLPSNAADSYHHAHPSALPANLANLSQIVSRIPETEVGLSPRDKDEHKLRAEAPVDASILGRAESVSSKAVHPSMYSPSSNHGLRQSVVGSELLQSSLVAGRGLQPSDLGIGRIPQADLGSGRGSHSDILSGRGSQSLLGTHIPQLDLGRSEDADQQLTDRSQASLYHHQQIASQHLQSQQHLLAKQQQSLLARPQISPQSQLQPPIAHQKSQDSADRPGSRNMLPPPHSSDKSHGYLQPKTMWSSSLPSSLASSLPSSLTATMASFALAGQKGLSSIQTQLTPMDRAAALASLASRGGQTAGNLLFPHDFLQRSAGGSSQGQSNSNSVIPSGTSSAGLPGQSSSSSNRGFSGSSGTSIGSGSGSGSGTGAGGSSGNVERSLARSYASMMPGQSSPLFGRGDGTLTPGSLPRSLSGASSPFLPQSPGLGAALTMPGPARTPTPAHQQSHQSLSSNFPSIPRDPISQSHPSLQIPSLNSIASTQASLSQLASYNPRDSLALMNQSGRGSLVGTSGSLVDTPQLYQQYLQRQQLAQDELLRSAGVSPQLAAHQSMMLHHGLMSAYPSGYPPSLGLRSGSYQGMNRPWI